MRVKLMYVIAALILVGAGTSITAYHFLTPRVKEEFIGGKYNAKIVITGSYRGFDGGDIIYTKEGTQHRGYYSSYLKSALEWIKANTPENATFLSWWDYGHMIVGYAERETIIKNPSTEALDSVADPKGIKEFDSHEKLVEVAKALTATDENFTKSLMNKYGADYIFIATEDGAGKAVWIFHFAGLNSTDYMTPSSLTFTKEDYTDLGKQTLIYRLLSSNNFEGFTQVYSDENVRIFKSS